MSYSKVHNAHKSSTQHLKVSLINQHIGNIIEEQCLDKRRKETQNLILWAKEIYCIYAKKKKYQRTQGILDIKSSTYKVNKDTEIKM